MTTAVSQRWSNGRDSYRPAGEVIQPREYEVAAFDKDLAPKQFVRRHHYSGSYPAARFRFGLWRQGELVGAAVFSHPCNDRVLTSVFPGHVLESVELGRFVLLDEVPGNGETWFLARAFELLRKEGLIGVVSFSDPQPRATSDGRTMFPGHYGGIYQAFNGHYLGRGRARLLRLLPDGLVFSDRAVQKIRAREQGWRYSAAILERYGAAPPGEDLLAWLGAWLPKLTRRLRHRGNHRYAWPLHRRLRLVGGPYPKSLDGGS